MVEEYGVRRLVNVKKVAIAFFSRKVGPYILIFFFNDTATTEIYTLSLHDALPI